MRSWENRPDTVVVDEPLYSYYLTHSGIDHPAREKVMASQPSDLDLVVSGLLGPVPGDADVYYQKHMCHHLLPETDVSWIPELRNVLLIRDPAEVVASYQRSRAQVVPDDIGVERQLQLFELLSEAGDAPPVVDAADFLADPPAYLRWLCDWMRIPFDEAMLSWPAGPRDSDGVWGPHWYSSVWQSTGFQRPGPKDVHLDPAGQAVVQHVRPAFLELASHRLRL